MAFWQSEVRDTFPPSRLTGSGGSGSRSHFYHVAEEGLSVSDMMREVEMFKWPSVNLKHEPRGGGEADPFLDPPVSSLSYSTPKQPKKRSTRPKRTPAIRRRSAGSTKADEASTGPFLYRFGSESEASDDEEVQQVPWESLRHKSIKRGILEQVKKENNWVNSLRGSLGASFRQKTVGNHDIPHRGADEGGTLVPSAVGGQKQKRFGGSIGLGKRITRRHERTDSDLRVEDLNLHLFRDRGAAQTEYVQPLSLNMTRPVTLRSETNQTEVSAVSFKSETGFRIVEDSPLPTPGGELPEEAINAFASGWWGEDLDGHGLEVKVDKYTPMPVKLSASRTNSHSNSRCPSPTKLTPVRERRFTFTDGGVNHATVLPQSPPLITSPCLESQLFFTPIPPPAAKTSYPRSALASPERTPTLAKQLNRRTRSTEPRRNPLSPNRCLASPLNRLPGQRVTVAGGGKQIRSPTAAAAQKKVRAQRTRQQPPSKTTSMCASATSEVPTVVSAAQDIDWVGRR